MSADPTFVSPKWETVSRTIFLMMMTFDNKTLLIIGLIIGGVASLYTHQTELASAIFGGMVGYLSKDTIKLIGDDGEANESEKE